MSMFVFLVVAVVMAIFVGSIVVIDNYPVARSVAARPKLFFFLFFRPMFFVLITVFFGMALLSSSAHADVAQTAALPNFAANGDDPAVAQFGYIFGSLFNGGAGTTIMTSFSRLLNTVVLGVAGSFFLYQLATGVVQTAHEGKILAGWSSLWVPIRFVVAGIAMVPVHDGYCVMQTITAQITTIGLDAGHWIWSQTMSQMLQGGVPISAQIAPDYDELAHGIWKMSVCRWESNLVADGSAANWPQENAFGNTQISSTDGDGQTAAWSPVFKNAKGFPADACGHVAYIPTGAAAEFPSLAKAHIAATTTLINTLDGLAKRLVAGQRVGASQDDQQNQPTSSDIRNAITQAQASLTNSIQAALSQIEGNSTTASNTMQAINAGGWLFAGTWYNYIASQNQSFADALNGTPTFWNSTTGNPRLSADAEVAGPISAAADALWNHAFNLTANGSAMADWRPPPGDVFMRDGGGKKKDLADDTKGSGVLSSMTDAVNKMLSGLQTAISGAWMGAALNNAPADPMGTLVAAGYNIMNTVFAAMTLEASGAAGIGLTLVGGVALLGVLNSPMGYFFTGVCLGFLAVGGFLSTILPMTPYVLWISSVVAYAVLVIEAVVAAPLWCFAHLKAGGKEAHGEAGAGYAISFNILMRPSLMVGGMLAGMVVLKFGVTIVNVTYGAALADSVAGAMATTGSVAMKGTVASGAAAVASAVALGLSGAMTLLWTLLLKAGLYVAIIIMIAERSFSLIHKLPDAVSRWVGVTSESLEEAGLGQNIRGAIVNVHSQKRSMLQSKLNPPAASSPRRTLVPPTPGGDPPNGKKEVPRIPVGAAEPPPAETQEERRR